MALKRPTVKKLTAEEAENITKSYAGQTAEMQRVTSYDPNYPVFQVPISQKVLVYVPNHQVIGPDGSVQLRKDAFNAHPVIDGRTFGNVRCLNGMTSEDPQLKWDGTCPLCDAINDCWELYNYEYADIARGRGIAIGTPEEQELLKNDRIELLRGFKVKQAERWFTFPIVVIDCVEKDGQLTTQPKLTADGQIVGTPMWYTIRERTFVEKWEAGYDSIDGETPTSPAGLWAVLNFTYQPKNGKPDRMGSARALKVTYKTMQGYGEWEKYFDKITEDWTPEKAQEVVVLDVLRSMEETVEVADSVMKPVRDKIALYKLNGPSTAVTPAAGIGTTADQTLANFGATPAAPAAPSAPSAPSGAPFTGEMPSNAGLA